MDDFEEINFDAAVQEQLNIKKKLTQEILEIEEREVMGTATAADKTRVRQLRSRVSGCEDEIERINRDRKAEEIAAKSIENSANIAEERQILQELAERLSIGYLSHLNKFIYCMDAGKPGTGIVNPIFAEVEAAKFQRVLKGFAKNAGKSLPRLTHKTYTEDLFDSFLTMNRYYVYQTSSFHERRWDPSLIYNSMQVIRKHWVQPDYANAANYDSRFDLLMYCVGGGKKENIDHLEKWIAYKWMYPEKNGDTPNLDIGGYPGGNGKGRYAELCKTIFTGPCVVPAALKELMDGFNGTWEMASVLYYDEPAANELPEGKLKQATGSEDMRSEKKGIDAKTQDRNYNLLFLSNNQEGVVKLSGTGSGGEDRRYSVMVTNKVLTDEVLLRGLATNDHDAGVYVNGIAQLVKDRAAVARWLAHVIQKHEVDKIEKLFALHGEDYRKRFEDQKKDIDVAFDLIYPIFEENRCIPAKTLHQLVVALTRFEYKQMRVSQKWEQYLNRKRVAFEADRARVKHRYADQDIYEQAGVSVFKLAGETSLIFNHDLIAIRKPVKDTKYNSDNIRLTLDRVTSTNMFDYDDMDSDDSDNSESLTTTVEPAVNRRELTIEETGQLFGAGSLQAWLKSRK